MAEKNKERDGLINRLKAFLILIEMRQLSIDFLFFIEGKFIFLK